MKTNERPNEQEYRRWLQELQQKQHKNQEDLKTIRTIERVLHHIERTKE